MKLCTFSISTSLGLARRVGVAVDNRVVDATAARIALLEHTLQPTAAERVGVAQVPPDMAALIGSGPAALEWVREALDFVLKADTDATSSGMAIAHSVDSVRLLAPLPRPAGIACFVTWAAHIEDSRDKGFAMLQFPSRDSSMRAYYKANPDAVEGPGTTIPRPAYAAETDVECEMAAVIGVGGRDLTVDQARAAIVGYTIFNDVSYREIQRKEMAFGLGPTKGKDADHSNVLGPWLVTADEVGDPQDLGMAFVVNGNLVGSYHTSKMAWGFADLVSYLSRAQTLRPGQIVTSGAFPGGCGLDAGIRLAPGDLVEMRIDKLGSLLSTIG
jgi:2-keto-4-pentenoate hydratase/2-oxohepta-3-ene-1,7-dioic acid hydratase in catechol pathway